jgi:hypothetical protein
MKGKSGFERLFGWTRVRPKAGIVDATDVGTAFGMELSIEDARRRADSATPDQGQRDQPAGTPAAPRKPG